MEQSSGRDETNYLSSNMEQPHNQMASHNGYHSTVPNTPIPQQVYPAHIVRSMPQMMQAQNVYPPVVYQDFSHQTMLRDLSNLNSSIRSFGQYVDNFTFNMAQMSNAMHARLTRAEFERDQLRAALYQQPDTAIQVPQTAPDFGSRNSRFRDGEDSRQSSPVTPTKPSPQEVQDFSVPAKNDDEHTPFGSKLTGNNNKKSEKTKARKELTIKVPGQAPVAKMINSMPTPTSKASSSFSFPQSARILDSSAPPSAYLATPLTGPIDTSPLTPDRIGPDHPTTVRSSTIMNKRKIHNLEKLVPAATAFIPMLPLTDTEIIVYFFQSLARPIVSLRLYARNWGPSHITDTLNAHREIEGGYLRNTASVKCTTAIKRGKEKYGDAWADDLRPKFLAADDIKATDMMQLNEQEAKLATDFEIAALSTQLKKHPQEGKHGGIFTRCVKWCVEHEAKYTLKNVHELAWALRNGVEPKLPGHPDQFAQDGVKDGVEDAVDDDADDGADDEVDSVIGNDIDSVMDDDVKQEHSEYEEASEVEGEQDDEES